MTPADGSAPLPLILVVDDAHALRLVMSRALRELGYDVLTAPDGQSATVLVRGLRTPPDLVVTDIRMPAMDGEALAAWLAKHYPRVPVIFVSGFPSEAPGELPGPLLAKPFTPEALCAIVRETLARRHPAAPMPQ